MAVYRFKIQGQEPYSLGSDIVQFMADSFTYKGNAFTLEEEDYTFASRTKKAVSSRDHQDTMKETVEIEYTINRIRIGEIEGKEGMGVEGHSILKMMQKQTIDMLGVPPAQPKVLRTEWLCEVNRTLENDLQYTKQNRSPHIIPILVSEVEVIQHSKSQTLQEAIPPVSPLILSKQRDVGPLEQKPEVEDVPKHRPTKPQR